MMKRPEQRKNAFRMKRHKRPEQHDNGKIKPIICRSYAQIRFYCLVVFLCSDLSI